MFLSAPIRLISNNDIATNYEYYTQHSYELIIFKQEKLLLELQLKY